MKKKKMQKNVRFEQDSEDSFFFFSFSLKSVRVTHCCKYEEDYRVVDRWNFIRIFVTVQRHGQFLFGSHEFLMQVKFSRVASFSFPPSSPLRNTGLLSVSGTAWDSLFRYIS